MLQAKIISNYGEDNSICFTIYGEHYTLPEYYELQAPFYVAVARNEIVAAFQDKEDLFTWMYEPMLKNSKPKH